MSDDPFLISGSKVLDGTGSMLVVAVGTNSYHGRMMMALRQESSSATPLQIKLAHLADIIAKLGAAIALAMLLTLTVKYFVQLSIKGSPLPPTAEIIGQMLLIVIETVTIVVVAVPEGLPMAVTLALAYATIRMLKDNNLVRVLAACETMGNATSICSDKTGTLTENKMTVVMAMIGETEQRQDTKCLLKDQSSHVISVLAEGIAVNSTAFQTIDPTSSSTKIVVGNKTEVALVSFIIKNDIDINQVRSKSKVIDVYPFSSLRKSMTTVIEKKTRDMVRIHVKGASEIILAACTHQIMSDGTNKQISNEMLRNLKRFIAEMAENTLRTIAVAYRDLSFASYFQQRTEQAPPLQDLTLLALFGIEDPLRPGVAEAVAKCQRAGIFIRMITGDNMVTAQAIARKCGILMRGGLVMDGARFRTLDDATLEEIIPRLQVLARSSPLDKQILVRKLRQMGEIVAVTGDGSNDGPALRSANVGFAMGIAGTEVAKEASSIVLLDDNFASIVKAVEWGRCVNDSVRKFLQFQLTVNVSAVLIAFITAVIDPTSKSALNTVQLLWINLIMDTFAALALATDIPTEKILDRQPEDSKSNLITESMFKLIVGQTIFQVTTILLLISFGRNLQRDLTNQQLATFIFNTFVFLQLFNEINCRILHGDELNPFRGILTNRIFLSIWFGTVTAQVLIVSFGGLVFEVVPLSLSLWLISLGIALFSLPVALIIRLLPKLPLPSSSSSMVGEPHRTRVIMTRERLRWQAAISDVRRSLAFYSALRRARQPIHTSIENLEN